MAGRAKPCWIEIIVVLHDPLSIEEILYEEE
jgi:hypothetical protein